jgi:UDP-N-acetyl-D-glucosamine dehydrogenase
MASQNVVELMNGALTEFRSKLETKSVQVGVVGLGYVGLPLGLLFARKGFRTTGFDIDPSKVEMLERGESYIRHLQGAAIAQQVQARQFQPTADFTRLRAMDAIIICVPTPLDAHREPDLTYIRDTAASISPNLRRGQLVVLESTTYPGTTEEVVLPILENSGLRCSVAPYTAKGGTVGTGANSHTDFFLAFSPERKDPAT